MNDKALSPVIGVILMVCITVILAAVIAAFIFTMTDTLTPLPDNRINGTVIDKFSYDGENLFIGIRSFDPSGAVIDQVLWTDDPVMFHQLYTGKDYTFITKPAGVTKYPSLIGVR